MNGVNPSEITWRPMPRVLDSAGVFYRLSVCPVDLPLLRDHTEDICLLVRQFAMDYAAHTRKQVTATSK
jgi:transcriptional regulator with GAF, ATPase, and Fis domain